MRNYNILAIVSLFFFLAGCTSTVPVKVVDYRSSIGGANITQTITQKPVTYDDNKIKGISDNANTFTTALIYKDENNKYVTKYSETNGIELNHVEMVGLKKDYINLNISRYFYKDQQLMSCCTLGAVPPFVISNSIYMTIPASPYSASNSFGYDFAAGVPIELILTVQNNGDKSLKEDFIIVDVLPDYLEFQSASYNGYVEQVAYDLHVKAKNQILAFKVTPKENGFDSNNYMTIKITAKPVLSKFTTPEYKVK